MMSDEIPHANGCAFWSKFLLGINFVNPVMFGRDKKLQFKMRWATN